MISQRERGELARFYTVTEPKKHKKGYTVYKVTARIISRKNPEDIQEITVWKRYSDFKKLHRDLWQIHRSLYRQPELFPPFAKAKVFGRFDESVIEERRQCSEDLLQFSANIPALYGSQYIQDFFKDGEVQDGSELIGPAEPFSDFLADSLSDCSSDVHKDIGGVDDLTGISQSEHGGLSSDSDLISLLVDGDSLAELDDGMASGGSSPKQPAGGSRRDASPSRPELEPSRGALFPSSLRKKDYLERASEQISLALQKEVEQDFTAALTYYRIGVDLLLQGVQGELNLSRREAVKKKTAEYLMRAEVISNTHLKGIMGQNSTQNRTLAAQCCKGSWGHQSQADELHNYRVLGVIDKVLLVMDKRTQETLILKGLRKSSECARVRKTVVPRAVPNMVRLRKFIISDDSIFLLLQYAEGGKLWSHITKYLHADSPDNSFDIPFIQKSHVASGHQAGTLDATPGTSASASSRPSLELQEEGATPAGLTQLGEPGLGESGRVAPLANSGDTSEEECTNSYLTLCNEYEQEKVESEVLGEEEDDAEEAEEDPNALGGEGSDVAMGRVRAKARSSLSTDCLCSPITAQELCFFTEEEEPRELPHLLPLDQSIRSSTELFPVNSKESTGISRTLFSTSDLGSEITDVTEDPLEVGEVVEVKGHVTDLWRFDSDQGSNESVPVISFKEAMVEDATACYVDDGRPPDLLVNLPGVGGVTGVTVDDLEEELVAAGVAFAVEAKPSPKFGKPDVLQLGEEAGLDLSFERDVSTSSVSCSHSDTDGQKDYTSSVHSKTGSRTLSSSPLLSGSASPSSLLTPPLSQSDPMLSPDPHPRPASPQSLAAAGTGAEEPGEGRSVSELFRQLDGLAEVALHTHIPETLVRTWAVDMLLALDALHQEGIICRDLNPSNILLDHRGHVELTYFCSWSEVEELCDANAVAKMYCAPEVGGISEETAACDWWSLGALLYELLTGKSLHQCHPAGIGRHTSLNVPEFVSEEARSLLEQLLQYNPVERLGTGGAGVEDIKSHPFFAQVNWPK